MSQKRLAALTIAALLAATAGSGCGDDASDGNSGGSPGSTVATVGDVEIAKRDLDRQVAILARAQTPAVTGKLSREQRKQFQPQALAALLQNAALEQEAAGRDITVTEASVRKNWNASKRRQFKTKRALRRFLHGQTEQQVIDQLRLQALAQRIYQQISEQAGGGKKGAKATQQFQTDFQEHWAGQTSCADGYTAPGCDKD